MAADRPDATARATGDTRDDPASSGDADEALARAAARLYAVLPGQFVAARGEEVRRARDAADPDTAKQIAALRRPSVAAWAVNRLVRTDPDLVQRLLALGEALRSAQTRLDAAALKGLRPQREAALTDVVAAAAAHAEDAGQPLSTATATEVRESAVAALASPQAAAAFGSGGLTRALHYSGFGEVDVADAVARTPTGVALAVIRGGRGQASPPAAVDPELGEGDAADRARAEARREGELRRAELAAARARRDLEATTARLEEAREASERARERVAQVRAELSAAEAEDERRLVEVTDAVRARSQAQAALESATDAVRRLAEEPDAGAPGR